MTPWTLAKPECIWPARAILGESPVWSQRDQALWWVDIKAPALHRYEPVSNTRTSWRTDEPVGCIDAPCDGGRIFAAAKSGFVWLMPEPAGGHAPSRPIVDPEAGLPGNRFNDGKRAPDGSFWAGTMDDAEQARSGAWWRFDPDTGTARRLQSGYAVTNGPAFDSARACVYLTDSARRTVFRADWSPGRGPENSRVFLKFEEADGYPDGMQTDAEGGLWIAFWDAACLRRFSPLGSLVQTVALPARRPTSLAFCDTGRAIFVTTASIGLGDTAADGHLYRIGVKART